MPNESTQLTAQQEAYRYLRDRILRVEFAGGAKVTPSEIAELLGISRMPVREALRQLAAEGLVSMRPNRAAVVTRLTALEVDELFQIRTALEVMAVRYAVPALTPDSLADLVAIKERMDRASHDPTEWVKRHDEFHQAICELGNRKVLAKEIARIRQLIRPYILMYAKMFGLEMPGLEHASVIDALASRDVELAQKVMHEHVTNPGVGLIEFLRSREVDAPNSPASQGRDSADEIKTSADGQRQVTIENTRV